MKTKDFGPDYFTYPRLYEKMVRECVDGSIFVEIGCYYGRSTKHMANAIKASGKNVQFHCVDLWADLLDGTQDGKYIYAQFMNNLAGDNIIIHRGNSWDMAADFEDGSLDFVFIDGDHSYEGVSKDLKAYAPKLKKGAILAGHDWHHPPVKKALFDMFGEVRDIDCGEDCWILRKLD